MIEELKDRCDALIISTMLGIVDEQGRALTVQDVIPITQNQYGKRMLNVKTMRGLGIKPKRIFLVGTELVKN